jgi:hypothetical protein
MGQNPQSRHLLQIRGPSPQVVMGQNLLTRHLYAVVALFRPCSLALRAVDLDVSSLRLTAVTRRMTTSTFVRDRCGIVSSPFWAVDLLKLHRWAPICHRYRARRRPVQRDVFCVTKFSTLKCPSTMFTTTAILKMHFRSSQRLFTLIARTCSKCLLADDERGCLRLPVLW